MSSDHLTEVNETSMERGVAEMLPRFRVLGIKVNAVQIPAVIAQMQVWIAARSHCRFIAVTGMHGVTEAQHDVHFKRILNSADLVVPDGMPLVWIGRRHGHPLRRRVYGPELMQAFCRETAAGYRHFFYGGMPGIPELLAERMRTDYGITIAGTYSPPFRAVSTEEDDKIVKLINDSKADVLWVGLSTPKQERWMYEHRERLRTPVVAGVGAAFDLNCGKLRQAPAWMRENGLEWCFRLLMEPRRLWRRYLVYGSEFVCSLASEFLGLRTFE